MATTFYLEIDMDNAAFEDAPATELGRILEEVADRARKGDLPPMTLRDINGNKVGQAIMREHDKTRQHASK